MTTLSFDYVYALGRSVGLSKAQAILATAIAAAESGLNPKNVGDQTLAHYGSRGLWQIFTGAHNPAELGIGSGGWTAALVAKLEDPKTNAHAMWLISGHGKTWQPWSTYNHGSHKQYLPKAQAAGDRVGDNWAAVLGGVTPPPVPVPVPVPGATYVVTLGKNVRPGTTDPTTKDLQRALIATGFASFTKPNILGYYGQGTQDAVRRYFDRYPQFESSPTDVAIGPKGWAFLRDLALKGKS